MGYQVGDRIIWINPDGQTWHCTITELNGYNDPNIIFVRADEYSYTKSDQYHSVRLSDAHITLINKVIQSSSSGPAVNDHVCSSCGNKRCSKSEKVCWLCGNKL